MRVWIKQQRQALRLNKHVDPELVAHVLSKFDGYDWTRFTPEDLMQWLQPQALKPFHLRAIDIDEPGLFGAWIVTNDEPGHHFFYKTHLPRMHQVAVILHEVSHWACKHGTAHLTVAELATLTKGDRLNLDGVPGVCRRVGNDPVSQADWEAEAVALALFSRYISARIIQPVDSGLQRVLREEV